MDRSRGSVGPIQVAHGRSWLQGIGAAFALALAINSTAVLDRVYREAEAGLHTRGRDAEGRILPTEVLAP